MDYSEILTSTAETMTTKAEDLKSGHTSLRKIKEKPQIIENLHTSSQTPPFRLPAPLYLSDGSVYEGAYHIHVLYAAFMTGGVYDKNSQDLYTKKVKDGEIIDELVPTRRAGR